MNTSIFSVQYYNSFNMQNKNVPHLDEIQEPLANALKVKRILDDKGINRENLDQFDLIQKFIMARNQLNRAFCSYKVASLSSKAWSLIYPLLTDIGNRL